MSIITLVCRKIRMARLSDAIHRRNVIRVAYSEQICGLNHHIARLENEHLRDVTSRGLTSREIARGVERKAKAGVLA